VLIWRDQPLLVISNLLATRWRSTEFHQRFEVGELTRAAFRYRWSRGAAGGETRLLSPLKARGSKVASPLMSAASQGEAHRSATFPFGCLAGAGLGAIEVNDRAIHVEIAERLAANSRIVLAARNPLGGSPPLTARSHAGSFLFAIARPQPAKVAPSHAAKQFTFNEGLGDRQEGQTLVSCFTIGSIKVEAAWSLRGLAQQRHHYCQQPAADGIWGAERAL